MRCRRKDILMSHKTRITILLTLGVLISLFTVSSSDAKQTHRIRYHYIELGTLGGQYSWSTGINNWGQVVGVSEIPGGGYRGFLWSEDKMKNLGSLDDDFISATWFINDKGEVVGFSMGFDGQRQAILWDREGMHPLETLGGTSNDALGINTHGEIVGWSLTSEDLFHAAMWDSHGITDLAPTRNDTSWAISINKKGEAVGSYFSSDERLHAILWDREGLHELESLGGDESEVLWINDKGQAVGWCDLPGSLEWHACLWDPNGDILDLGPDEGLNSEAYSINEHGQVVGLYYPGESLEVTRSFLWTRKHGMMDLKSLTDMPDEVDLVIANSINDFGWITGMNSTDKAYVLIPYKSDKEIKHHNN
jgi:probable HAF family extracellular repeat protein